MCFCHSAEEDASELDRLRRLLCIPRADVDKVNREICGRIYQEVSPRPLPISGTAMAGGVAYVPAWRSSGLLHGFLCVRTCFGVLCPSSSHMCTCTHAGGAEMREPEHDERCNCQSVKCRARQEGLKRTSWKASIVDSGASPSS